MEQRGRRRRIGGIVGQRRPQRDAGRTGSLHRHRVGSTGDRSVSLGHPAGGTQRVNATGMGGQGRVRSRGIDHERRQRHGTWRRGRGNRDPAQRPALQVAQVEVHGRSEV